MLERELFDPGRGTTKHEYVQPLPKARAVTSTAIAESAAAQTEDAQFVARIRAGDREALQTVVQAYLGQILRAARAVGLSPQSAEDVTQATFATFIEVARRFEGRSRIRTFLFGILYKKIAEARREGKRDRRMDAIEDVVEQRFKADGSWQRPPRPMELQLHDAEIREAIEGCLDGVPTQQRFAFALRDVLGFTTKEICNILEITRTNLGVQLYRARNRLRECLEAKSVTE